MPCAAVTAPTPGSVVVVDDDADIRLLLRAYLPRALRVELVGEAANGLDAIDSAARHEPDVLVLDHQMPHLCGLEAVAAIRAASPTTRIVLFSALDLGEAGELAGVDAVVSKGSDMAGLVAAIDRCVQAGPVRGR